MQKTTFNALLNHKAHNYKPMQIEVEKVIPLYGKRFEQMRDHPLDDCPEIIENRELMYISAGIFAVAELVVSTPIDLQNPTKSNHSMDVSPDRPRRSEKMSEAGW